MDQDMPSSRRVPAALAVVAVLLIAVNLRPGATTLGPVMQEVGDSLALSGSLAGLLAALPGLCFGAVGFLAVRLAARLGLSRSIALGALFVVLGLTARVWVGSPLPFLLLTVLGLAGMALGNVLVPAWIKLHGRDRTVALMTVYSVFLTVGGSGGALLSAPTAALAAGSSTAGEGWRWALGAWGLVALVPLLVWWFVARRTGHDFPAESLDGEDGVSLVRSPTAVALAVLFGLQSMNAYVQFAWLPQILRDAGLPATSAGAAVALVAGTGVIGALAMPTVISRARTLTPWMVLFGAATFFGYAGLLWAPAAGVWLWAAILGVGGMAFPTVIALIPARSRDPHVTARLSGFVQPSGYLLAAVGPFVVGLLHDLTGGWTAVLVLLALSGVGMTVVGLRVAGRVTVDDELASRRGGAAA